MKKLTSPGLLWLAFFCYFPLSINAQNQKIDAGNYARISMTMLVLDYGDSPYMEYFRKPGQLDIPDKFDDNNLTYTLLPANFERSQIIDRNKVGTGITFGTKNQMNTSFIEPLFGLVKNYKVPNAIIAKEFNRQEDGSFNMDIIAQRGLYNANTTDYQKANATMRKEDALRDAGELLLNNSYILIFDFVEIKTMTEVYNAMDANSQKPVARTQNGYKANGNAYLYKIDFNDSVYNNFLLSMWVDASFEPTLKQERAELFNNNIFPVKRIANLPFAVEALQYNADQGVMAPKVQKTPDQLFEILVSKTNVEMVTNIEKLFSQFRVKSQITSVRPIGVKIGTKEGLKLDQRYYVYETQLDASGKEFSKRMGVIRSKNIVENRFNISDKQGLFEPSLFYQTAGKKLSNMGMYVEQKNDWGFGLCLGYAMGNMGGANVSLEFNIMSVLNSAMNLKSGITALKIYIGAGLDLRSYESNYLILQNIPNQNILFYKFEGGLAKDFYFARNFHIGPVIGVGLETAGLTEDYTDPNNNTSKYTLETLYGKAGLRFGFNIRHNVQLQITSGFILPMGTVTEDIRFENKSISGWPKDLTENWDEIFTDRQGVEFGGGLRLQF